MNRRDAVLAMLALGAAPLTVKAQQFPSKRIVLICPYPAGGSTDIALRAFAGAVGNSLGQPVVIENKSGAVGTMGAVAMVSARPDGYTLAMAPLGVVMLPHIQKVGFDPLKDLTYIICLTGYTFGIVVRADSPWKTFKDVVDWARENPGRLSCGTSSLFPHFGMAMIAANLGVKFLEIPFKGGADNMQSLLGGHTMLLADSTGWAPQVNDGSVRLLVTWGAERTKSWPNVPILKELGLDIVVSSPWGITGPRDMNPQLVKIIHDAFHKALEDEHVRQTLERLDQPIIYMNTAEYTDFMRKEFERTKAIVEKFGMPGQS